MADRANFLNFEFGPTGEPFSVGGGPAVQQTVALSGAYSVLLAPSSFVSFAHFNQVFAGADVALGNDLIIGFLWRCENVTPATEFTFLDVQDSVGSRHMQLRLATNGSLVVRNSNDTEVASVASGFSNATTHRIEVRFRRADPGVLVVKVDGSIILNRTTDDYQSGTAVSHLVFFRGAEAGGPSVYVDDIYIDHNATSDADFLSEQGDGTWGISKPYGVETGDGFTQLGTAPPVGSWPEACQIPYSAVSGVAYNVNNVQDIGGYRADGLSGTRFGPAGDTTLAGKTLLAAKYIHVMTRSGAGSDPTYYRRYGNSVDGMTDQVVVLNATTKWFQFITTDPTIMPEAGEYFESGVRKDANGTNNLICYDTYNSLLYIGQLASGGYQLVEVFDEGFNVSETLSVSRILVQVSDEALNIAEAVEWYAKTVYIHCDPIVVYEGSVSFLEMIVSSAYELVEIINETFQEIEVVVKSIAKDKILSEAINISETFLGTKAIAKVLDEVTQVTETAISLVTRLKVVNEVSQITSTIAQAVGRVRVVDEVLAFIGAGIGPVFFFDWFVPAAATSLPAHSPASGMTWVEHGGFVGIIDQFSASAFVAISARRLTGVSWGTDDGVLDPLVRLRGDDVGNTEKNFSYGGNNILDKAAIAAWKTTIGATNLYYVKKFDQSGNDRHWAQDSAASQPLYVAEYQNGIPGIRADGIDDAMFQPALAADASDWASFWAGGASLSYVATLDVFSVDAILAHDGFGGWYIQHDGTGPYKVTFRIEGFSINKGNWRESSPGLITVGAAYQYYVEYNADSDANNPVVYHDGVLKTVDETAVPSGTYGDSSTTKSLMLFDLDEGAGVVPNMTMGELILFKPALSGADRATLLADQNSVWAI